MKRMMFIIAVTIICIGCSSTRSNQKYNKAKHPLIGMWQYCQPIGDDEAVILTHRPIYKIINSDNSYFVSAGSMVPVEGTEMQEVRAVLTQNGKYEIVNDSVYKENIAEHVNKSLINTTSIMQYKFTDESKEYIKVDFVNTETGISVQEIWRRVVFDSNR